MEVNEIVSIVAIKQMMKIFSAKTHETFPRLPTSPGPNNVTRFPPC